MPFCLEQREVVSDLDGVASALIVPCRFCPAANAAIDEGGPYVDLFRSFLRTPSYVSRIERLKASLRDRGIRTDVFDSKIPNQFILCMWTRARREKLAREATRYDAVLVLGCEAAVQTVRDSLAATDVRVVAGMETRGIMSVIPSIKPPVKVFLERSSVSGLRM